MTHPPMEPQAQITFLAEKIMGWTRHDYKSGLSEWYDKEGAHAYFTNANEWTPLTDWNHWRQVEEKVMEDEELWSAWIKGMQPEFILQFDTYMNTSISKRVSALIAAHQSLYPLPSEQC